MVRKKEQNEGSYWYWNAPAEDLSIEDCEQIAQESLKENKNQKIEKRFSFAVFT